MEEKTALKHRGVYSIPLIKTRETRNSAAPFLVHDPPAGAAATSAGSNTNYRSGSLKVWTFSALRGLKGDFRWSVLL